MIIVYIVEVRYGKGEWHPTVMMGLTTKEGTEAKRHAERQARTIQSPDQPVPKYRVKRYRRER